MYHFLASIASSQVYCHTGHHKADRRFIPTTTCPSGEDERLIDDEHPTLSAAMITPAVDICKSVIGKV